jgi:hypothetical protein
MELYSSFQLMVTGNSAEDRKIMMAKSGTVEDSFK